jgi:hypothetical protein
MPDLIAPEKWYQDPHVWAMILADTISILGVVSNYVPPKYGAGIIALSHALYSIDQIVTGAIKNQTPTTTDTVITTSTAKTSTPIDSAHIEL